MSPTKKKKQILLVASEAMPLCKTGGLADVVGALPPALRSLGAEVAVMIPKHHVVKEKWQKDIRHLAHTEIDLGWRKKYLGVEVLEVGGIPYYLIDNEDYFSDVIYRGGDAENEQYLFYCRAVVEALKLLGMQPDVVHTNDWHTGLVPMLLRTQYAQDFPGHPVTVHTIHNIKYQGAMDFTVMEDMLSIPAAYNTPQFVESHGAANMMKAGIVFADRVTTVSPTYAREILDSYYAFGLEGILQARIGDLSGIVNGIDTVDFDPLTDPALAENYDVSYILGKRGNKKALRAEYDMKISLYDPVICMVGRLTEQKGPDLVMAVLEELLIQEQMGFILIGSGEKKYVDFFNYIAAKYPEKTGVWIGYDEGRARRIYAGSDFLLMPSQFEPCGLSQQIAQRYGTLPIVRETGGLIDTVLPYNQYTKEGDGFSFTRFNAHDMLTVIRLALSVYRNKPVLRALKKSAMLKDNSFLKSAERYLQLYEQIQE